MSKFNLKNINKPVNKSGNVAYKMDDKERLITEVLTSFFIENKFYGDNSSKIVEDIRKIAISDSRFLANLTLYTRKEMHLRSISHVLAGELSKSVEGKKYAKEVIKNIVERPAPNNAPLTETPHMLAINTVATKTESSNCIENKINLLNGILSLIPYII